MGIENVGVVWNEYCSRNAILKILLPISMPLLIATAVLKFAQNFIRFGVLAGTIIYVLFFLSVLLTFAKSEYRVLAAGFGIYMLDCVYSFLRYLIKYHRISWSSVIYLLLWGFFAYMSYKKFIRLGGN